MQRPKRFILYSIIGALGLGIIVLTIISITEYSASKNVLSSLAKLKQQTASLQSKFDETEEVRLRLEMENKQLRAVVETLNEFQISDEKSVENKGTKGELKEHSDDYKSLKEEYDLLQEAYNELLKEQFMEPEPSPQRRGREFTPEQMENFAAAMRERTYSVMDSRISQAKTEYEAGILTEIRDVSINLFDLQDKMRIASDEEREALRQTIAEEINALTGLYSEYNSYQWETLAEKFKIENVEEFTKQVHELMRNMQFPMFGGWMSQQRRE
ncbi:MAG: hypothetical protein PHW62_04225 [Candidatus Ratteibacteria bacterium]|nr:hypothetical protein [Candidatus Ratteibacteria bacterium]